MGHKDQPPWNQPHAPPQDDQKRWVRTKAFEKRFEPESKGTARTVSNLWIKVVDCV